MNKNCLVATNACRWKYRRINLRLRHSNNADKKFQQFKRLNFSNHPIRYSTEATNGDMDFNPANQQLLR